MEEKGKTETPLPYQKRLFPAFLYSFAVTSSGITYVWHVWEHMWPGFQTIAPEKEQEPAAGHGIYLGHLDGVPDHARETPHASWRLQSEAGASPLYRHHGIFVQVLVLSFLKRYRGPGPGSGQKENIDGGIYSVIMLL